MEVDVDFDLVNKLNVLGTCDHEDLLKQFQTIVGNQMSPSCCSFYLEMGNWNLQTALCAYYDVFSTQSLPSFVILDETFQTGDSSLVPNQTFLKRWKIQNKGEEKWPPNLKVKHVNGPNFEHADQYSIPAINPEEVTEISILMTAPSQLGLYESIWRMITLQGTYCGVPLMVSINVEENPSINLLTNQMSALGQEDPCNSTVTVCNGQLETNSFVHSTTRETFMVSSPDDGISVSHEVCLLDSLQTVAISDHETIELIDYENI